jgi:glycosyltransferase involved in cell wall biosynthesis
LREYAAKYDKAGKVKFLGYLPPEKLRDYTRNATIGINLLENLGLSYYYSLSNKFFDYIHAQVPQITMDFPEYRTLNDEHKVAILLSKLDDSAISDSVNSLLRDTAFYGGLRENCKIATDILNWQNEEKKLLRFFDLLK